MLLLVDLEWGITGMVKGFIILLSLFFISNVYAANLDSAIKMHTKTAISYLNMDIKKYESDPYKFDIAKQEIKKNDLNGDGITDAIVSTVYCEKTSCHPTTNTSEVAVYLGKKDGSFRFIDSKYLGIYLDTNVTNKQIKVISYGYKDSDSTCCPTDKYYVTYIIKNNQLIKLK